jgi:nitroreductase
MEVLEAIKTRRSVRSFKAQPISDEDAVRILEAAKLAPSAGNRQAWTFIYVKDPRVLRMVKNCSTGFYGDAAAAIVVGIMGGGRGLGSLDVGFAAENTCLAAHALGIGSCAIGSFNREAVKMVVNGPEGWEPVLVISLGYPDRVPNSPPKKPLSDIAYLDAFGKKWEKLEGL